MSVLPRLIAFRTKSTFTADNCCIDIGKKMPPNLKYQVKVGIIGGSGFGNPDIISNSIERRMPNVFGVPSDTLVEGTIKNVPCVFLARHGRNHDLMPSSVNYRANIWALKSVGCTHIVASTACGSLNENIGPGDLVFLDSFIDRTQKRNSTFFDNTNPRLKGICHIPMEPAFCEETRKVLMHCAEELGLKYHPSATCVTIEGPRFSTRAESRVYRSWGCDVINMTTVPEVVLAKEAGLCYAAIGLITDYDCWRDSGNHVNIENVLTSFKNNIVKVIQITMATVAEIGERNWDTTIDNLKRTVSSNTMGKMESD